MSVVLNLVSVNCSWIASDGLARNSKTQKVLSDSTPKFEALHPHLYVGYTGTLEYAKAVINTFNKSVPADIALTIESAANLITQISSCLQSKTNYRAQFLLTGISDVGSFGTITISNENKCTVLIPTQENLCFAFLGNENHLDIGPYLRQQQRFGTKDTDTLVRKSMEAAIRDISKIDDTVNQNVFFHTISF